MYHWKEIKVKRKILEKASNRRRIDVEALEKANNIFVFNLA